MSGFDRGKGESTEADHAGASQEKLKERQRQQARTQGYSGDFCSNCGSPRLRIAGHCYACDDCGTTTGCS